MPHISLGRRRGWVEPSESRDVFSQAAQHNARFRTPKHGGRYLMDGGVADTACHTQAVVLLKLFNTTRKLSHALRTPFANRRFPFPSSAQAQEQCTGAVVCYAPDDDAIDGAQSPEEFPPQTHNLSALMVLNVDSPDRHDRLKSLWS